MASCPRFVFLVKIRCRSHKGRDHKHNRYNQHSHNRNCRRHTTAFLPKIRRSTAQRNQDSVPVFVQHLFPYQHLFLIVLFFAKYKDAKEHLHLYNIQKYNKINHLS